jgi:hypothetical protein
MIAEDGAIDVGGLGLSGILRRIFPVVASVNLVDDKGGGSADCRIALARYIISNPRSQGT